MLSKDKKAANNHMVACGFFEVEAESGGRFCSRLHIKSWSRKSPAIYPDVVGKRTTDDALLSLSV